jgi:hypothetical protein
VRLNGDDLRLRPIEARGALERLVAGAAGILFSDALATEGAIARASTADLAAPLFALRRHMATSSRNAGTSLRSAASSGSSDCGFGQSLEFDRWIPGPAQAHVMLGAEALGRLRVGNLESRNCS